MTYPKGFRRCVIISLLVLPALLCRAARAPDLYKPDFLEAMLPQRILCAAPQPGQRGFDKALRHIESVRHVELVPLTKEATAAAPIKQQYPARTLETDGDCIADLLVLVNKHGDVVALYVAYTDNPDWANHCLFAAAHWKFSPAMYAGTAVPELMCIPFLMHWES